MLIKTVTGVITTNSAGQTVESLPVREAVNGETDIAGRPIDVISVVEDARGVPVRFVPGKSALNSVGQLVDTVPVVGGSAPVQTAPAAFTSGQWSIADAATGGTATFTISALPSNGGSAITAIQYQVGSGAWTASGISSTGTFNITGLTNGASVNVKVRAVNAIGNGADSDVKSVTPSAAPANSVDVLYVAGSSNATSVSSSGNGGYSADPNTLIFDGTGWVPYEPNVNSQGLSEIASETTGPYFGPEAEFIKQYRAANGNKPLRVVKVSRGGTSFNPATTPNWNVATPNSLYQRLKNMALAAHAAITAEGFTPKPLTMLWTHGGNDATTEENANAAQQRTSDFITACRSEFMGQSAPWIISAIRPAVPQYSYPYIVRDGQIALALADPRNLLVSLDNISNASEQHPPNAGIIQTGLIYWQAFTGVLAPYILPNPTATVVENQQLDVALRAMSPVTWTISGGADAAFFSIAGSTLTLSARDYENPQDAGANNVYDVVYRATQPNGQYSERSIAVTVTNDPEGSIYEAEADALFQRQSVAWNTTEKDRANTLIKTLKEKGIFPKLKSLQIARHASNLQDSLLDWTRSRQGTALGAAALGSNGWTGGATGSDYIDTGVDPSVVDVSGYASSNSWTSVGVVSATVGSGKNVYGGNGVLSLVFASATTITVRQGNTNALTITPPDASPSGRWYMSRTSSGGIRVAKNGGARSTNASSSAALVAGNVRLFQTSSSFFGEGVLSYFAIGVFLTDQEEADFDAAMATYLA